jgi:microcystin-dependent protein
MSQPFLAEIKIISWNFAPKGWAFCNGQFLPINQNQALFSLLGTTYGGNGQTTFALPDFRSRIPIHTGGEGGWLLGQAAGEEFHTLVTGEMAAHNHTVGASNNVGTLNNPTGNIFAPSNVAFYQTTSNNTLIPSEITNVGGNQPHENRQPFLVLNFIIALQGIFPSRN